MQNMEWAENFKTLYDHAVSAYRAAKRNPAAYFSSEQTAFLAAIGCSPQEVFDFAEDWCQFGEPAFETVLLITAARRDYFLVEQQGRRSDKVIDSDQLPARSDELGGIASAHQQFSEWRVHRERGRRGLVRRPFSP